MNVELMNQAAGGRNLPRGNGPHVRFGRPAEPFDGPPSEIDEEEERPTRRMVPNVSPEAAAEYLSQFKMPIKTPLHIKVNFVPVMLLIFYLAAAAFYFYVRITKTLVTGPVFAYGIVVLVVEFLGLSATLPYAILLTISLVPKDNATGLPPEEEGLHSAERFNFHVRVLIPCYKEDMSVIKPTVLGALNADLPIGAQRTVYLCDDGNQEVKKQFIEQLVAEGKDVEYVSGRKKIPKDTNGKSSNLNNCLMNVIYKQYRYPGTKEINWEKIPETEIIVVFDADMVAKKHFFLRILEPLTNPKYALCLSPQAFHNIHPGADLFNNINLQFWEYWLPGAVAWGYIACTGTNFAIRARPLAHCGFFPTYTITEDYALGMELKKHGYKGSYLREYIAEGEAPDEVRNVMRQRSRWCKGHMQVFFSWKYSPLTQWRLSFFQKLWYSYGTWSYIVNVIATPVSLLIPFLSLGFGLNPVIINYWFAAGATVYYMAIFFVQTYFHQLAHIKSLWFANISNTVLWFTYTKAIMNVLLSKFGLKGGVGFKVTEKKVADPALSAPLAAVQRGINRVLSRVSSRRRDAPPPRPFEGVTYASVEKADAPTPGAPTPTSVHEFPPGDATPSGARAPLPPYSPLQSENSGVSVVGNPERPVNLTVVVNQTPREAEPLLSETRPLPPKRAPWYKRFASIFKAKNLVDMGGVLDPTALYIMLGFCLAVVGMAIWRTATAPAGGRGARYVSLSPYVGLPLFWALYNSIAPFLFVVYTFTSGKFFRKAAAWGQFLGTLTLLGAVVLLWATVPVDFNMKEATFKAGSYLSQLRTNAASFQDIAAISNGTASQKDVTGGWLISSDPVKYGMPLATSASLLAWSMLEFPQGYKDAQVFDESLKNVVAAGTYILNNLDQTDPNNPFFIAQVGDPNAYLTAGDAPTLGSIWTRLKDDPNLGKARQAFILDKDHVGVDLLAESAAALALSSVLVRNAGNAQQADSFVQGAVALFDLATSTKGREQSYCAFVPCGTTVSKERMVPVVPLPASANQDPADIKCWVPDFPLATCGFLKDEGLCLNAAQTAPVYTRRSSCCAFMRSAGVWQNQTTPQGACALPEGQFECFIPQLQTRDCLTQNISLETGKGCTGLGQDFFPTPESCCNQLTKSEAITASAPGRGVCALGPSTCFVPNTVSRTCVQLNSTSGPQCAAFGATDQFDSAITCCNSLVAKGAINADNPGRGVCADTALSSCWVADLAGKRCIELPSTLDGFTDARCSDFNSKTRFDDKAACCNGLYVMVGGVGPFFDKSCAPPPTPPPVTTAPVATAAVVVPKPTVPARRLLEDDVSVANRRLLQTVEVSPFLNLPQNVLAQQQQKLVQTTIPVDFYPSHTVLDDLSWAGVALFLATGQEKYLGDAQFYMTQHLAREAVGAQRNTDAGYYVYNYDTAVWAAAAVLARVTDLPQYHEQIRTFLRTWVELKPPTISPDVIASRQIASQAVKNQNMIKENIQTFNNQSFLVFDGCTPDRNNTKGAKLVAAQLALKNAALGATGPVVLTDPFAVTFEENCNDGRDNDCDGLTDMEDPDCPFMPVQSTDLSLAWTKDAPLPNAAAASFLALVYSRSNKTTVEQKRGLKCWALGQMRYMMGDNFLYPDSWSYVVGFGNKGYHRPTRVPDRESSCPADANQPCDFLNGFFPGLPNPQLGLVTGALVAGPNLDDTFTDSRTSNNTRIGADFQTSFLAAMSGLLDMGVDVKTCGQLQGVYNDVFDSGNL